MSDAVYLGSIQLKYCAVWGSLLTDSDAHKHYKNGVQGYCIPCRKIYDDLIRKLPKFFKNEEYRDLIEPCRDFIFAMKKNKNLLKLEDVRQKCKNKCSIYFKNSQWILTVEKNNIDQFLNSNDEYFVITVMSSTKGDYTVIGDFIYSRKEVKSFPICYDNHLDKYVAYFNAEIKFDDSLKEKSKKWYH